MEFSSNKHDRWINQEETNVTSMINNEFSTFWFRDIQTGELKVSKGIESLYKRASVEFEKDPTLWKRLFYQDDQAVINLIEQKLLEGEATDFEYRIILPDQTTRWIRDRAIPIKDENNQVIRTYGFLTDVTDYKNLQFELTQKQQQIQQIIESVEMIVWTHNFLSGDTIYSANSEKIFGVPPEAFQENSNLWWEVIHPEDVDTAFRHLNTLNQGHATSNTYRIIRPGDGQLRWINDRVIATKDKNDKVVGFQGVKVDVTESKMAEEKMHFMAYHDSLTGLPNRYHLNERLNQQLGLYHGTELNLAILFIDLDRFKLINDTLGHHYGDLLLKETASRLEGILSANGIVARQGGDEFIILVEETSRKQVEEIARKIIEDFSHPFVLEGKEFFTTPSIGISIYPEDGIDGETLVRNADLSMYEAKRNGKNRYRFFEANQSNQASKTISMEIALRKALMNHEFRLHYQPIIDMKTDDVVALEALIRWENPTQGLVSPLDFIPLAEETGLIVSIGEWVMSTACLQTKQWHELGHDVQISINVSIRQFQEENFVDTVEHVLNQAGLDPSYLILEITESVMQNTSKSITIINRLKDLGVQIAIDDFGTGYSSLSVLRNLTLDKIKIDKTFVNDIGTKMDPILKTMIDLAKNLNMAIVAEGVESIEHVGYLKEHHCDYGQGYFYTKPLTVEQMEVWMKNR
ncbi:bifunctional diguanylate cyclase/phosphodiesterase [Bacillus sp. AK128]